RRARRRAADGRRSVHRRDDRQRADSFAHGGRPRRSPAMTGPVGGESRYAAVVLPVPVNRPYIYEIPEALAGRVVPGARVVVPLRRRTSIGIVTDAIDHRPSAVGDIKPITAAPDDQPALSPALLELGRWLSDYYGAPLG